MFGISFCWAEAKPWKNMQRFHKTGTAPSAQRTRFVLTPGMDPTGQLRALAISRNVPWQTISLGQGQEPILSWKDLLTSPRCSTYGIFTHIWVIIEVNDGKYSIHGAYGIERVNAIFGWVGQVDWKEAAQVENSPMIYKHATMIGGF